MSPLRFFSKRLAVAASLSFLLLSGCGGNASNENTPVANGDNPPETSLSKYTAAVWEIERQRQATYRVLAENVPDSEQAAFAEVRCNQPDTIRGFSRTLRQEIVNYCDRVAEMIQAENLTVEEFNQIRTQFNEDPIIKNQVMEQLAQIQEQDRMNN
jgi:hypothetical protein